MDVRCPSCGTDYELDDARVPDTGLPVKCSKCGHVFRAMRPVTPSASEPARVVTGVHSIAPEWMIRRTSGEMVRFRELTTLQRWIVERKVSRNDEISKTGKKWEKLGNIPELAVFFQVVEGTAATPPPPPPMTNPAMLSYPAALAAADAAAQASDFRPTGPDPLSETMPDSSGVFRAAAPATEATPVLRSEPREPEEHRQETVRWDMSRGLPDDVRHDYEVSGERPGRDELMPRRFGAGQIIGSLVLLVVACGALAYALHPGWVKGVFRRFVSGTSTEAVRAVDEGYAALDADTPDGNDAAIKQFEAAAAMDEDYAAAHAGLAEALVARGELTRDDAEAQAATLAATPVEKPADALSAIADRRQRARADLERATSEAHKAYELDDTQLTSNRAMLDVTYLSGERGRQDVLAMQAHAVSPSDARLTMVLGAIALRDGNLEQAKAYLDAAIAADGALGRARYLRDRVTAKMNPPAPVVAAVAPPVVPSDVAPPGPTGVPAPPIDTPKENPAPPIATGPKTADDPSLTFTEAISRGASLRDHDKPALALKYYERAVILNVADPDAHLGVGLCNLDLRQSSAAIASFKKALELSPRFADAHFGLAEAFRARGNKLYAIRYYRSYLDIAPHGPEADVARNQLERLEDDNTAVTPAPTPIAPNVPTTPTPPVPPPAPEGTP